ncbi:asparagine synthase-related protein [Mesobacillus subterraneus]|uniref:asparagine synthase-related protein n=1 Tax=Mesobacillus subterraneus TaxID=285983 RepID=UPI001CFE512E|nr:asparagine synthase-related protein [Mesobacillus subterraneus]
MSAIAGIIHLRKEPVPFEHGRSIMKGLEKFPADDIQVWHKHNAFIGNHAQWITPESVGEQQPFYDSERQCVITADAIIDNREELFEKLQVERSKQKHMPDSQLILLAYYKWGEESPKHLVGDFAYMIWDERNQKLFGARDFSGSRTLYYYKDDNRLAFCTTIMPLFNLPGVKKELNEEWMAEFLAIPVNFESVDPSSTTYKQIEQLAPSHSISVKDEKVILSRYCYLMEGNKELKLKSDEEYEEAFRDVFQKAVKSRIRTQHSVGAHLSGGLDSGSVVSFAAKQLKQENKKLNTFSYVPVKGFRDWTHKSRVADESTYVKATVNHVGNIHDHYYSFSERSPFTEIDDWLETMETPYKFFENTFWLRGMYEKAQEKKVGVLLNGQRGNWTISWGPVLDFYADLFKKFRLISLYQEMNQYSRNIGVQRSKVMAAARKKAFPALYKLINPTESFHFPMIINPKFAKDTNVFLKLKEHGIDVSLSESPSAYEVRDRQFRQLYYWSLTGTYGAKLSLRYSVWERDPTNDLNVIKFCLSVPEEQFVRNGLDRALVRRSTKELLPDKVRMNMKSRGVQGADGVYRMSAYWDTFIGELEKMNEDPISEYYLNQSVLKSAIEKIKNEPNSEYAFDFDFRILMRSLIFYRYLKMIS